MSSSNSNEKAKLNAKYGKCVMASMYGKMLNEFSIDDETLKQVSNAYHDTDSHIINALDLRQGAPKGTSMYTLYEQSVRGWQKLPDHLLALTVQEFQEVMDDGLANGFEFLLQGSTILYREVQH